MGRLTHSGGDTPRASLFRFRVFAGQIRTFLFLFWKMANFDDPFDVASAEWMLEDPTGAAEYPGTQNLATTR